MHGNAHWDRPGLWLGGRREPAHHAPYTHRPCSARPQVQHPSFALLLVAATVGVLSPSGNEVGGPGGTGLVAGW